MGVQGQAEDDSVWVCNLACFSTNTSNQVTLQNTQAFRCSDGDHSLLFLQDIDPFTVVAGTGVPSPTTDCAESSPTGTSKPCISRQTQFSGLEIERRRLTEVGC